MGPPKNAFSCIFANWQQGNMCIYVCRDTNTYSVCIIAYLAEIFLIYMLVYSLAPKKKNSLFNLRYLNGL